MRPTAKTISDIIDEHSRVIEGVKLLLPQIEQVADVLIGAARRKKHLYLCGNGGSAADSQHMAAEYVGRLETGKELQLPATALTVDTSALTALGNDYGFDKIFSMQLKSLANEGDVLIAISTSGRSKNIIEAVRTAKEMGVISIAFTGGDGGELAKISDYALIAPSSKTARIQEIHELFIHILCELVVEGIR